MIFPYVAKLIRLAAVLSFGVHPHIPCSLSSNCNLDEFYFLEKPLLKPKIRVGKSELFANESVWKSASLCKNRRTQPVQLHPASAAALRPRREDKPQDQVR